MAEENETPKRGASELDDAQLAETGGGVIGGGWGTPFGEVAPKRIHRNCGGVIQYNLPFGLADFCSKCGESHNSLEEFDYYVEGMEPSIFSGSSSV